MKTNVLFAVVGKTPAVLTETLYALCVKKGVPIHEIEIITTQNGKSILRENGFFNRANPITQLFKDYKLDKRMFGVPIFNETRIHIPAGLKDADVNSNKNNHLMEAEITRRMRFLTSPEENYSVYASLSGGRKTMSAYMNLAVTIFARPEDKLFHVLHEGPGATAPEGWWYPSPKVKAQAKWVNLIDVPFLHLRNHLENIVPEVILKDMPLTKAKEFIDGALIEPKLTINLSSKREFILINGEPLKAEPRSLLWMAVLAWRKKNIERGYEMTTDIQSNYTFSAPEKDLISKGYRTLRQNADIDEQFYEKIKDPTFWAAAATRLNQALERQFRPNAVYLNTYGGGKKLGAGAICHYIKLDTKNITIQ